jgi:blocked early in transport 1
MSFNPMRHRAGGNTSATTSFDASPLSANNSNNSNKNNNMYGRRSNGVSSFSDVEGGRQYRAGGGGMSASDANSSILEQQNNERINELSEQVARLKGLTIDIGNEVREQNSLLDGMNDGFVNTRDLLTNSLSRIGTMLESGGTKHMCYMVLFIVFVLCFLWWLMSHKSTRGA